MTTDPPAVMRWARGAENLTTPLARPLNCLSMAFTSFSNLALPVPRMTI